MRCEITEIYLNLGYGTQSNARFSVAGVGADQGMDEQVERNAEHPEGLSDKRPLFITWFTEPGFECVFWRVCWTGGDSGSEEGGNRSDPGLRAASSHRDWWWSAQHRHHSLSFKGNEHPPVFITVREVKREMPLQLNEFIYLLLCCSCSAWLVCVCLQEGRTYVGRDDATNEQDISEFINGTLSLSICSIMVWLATNLVIMISIYNGIIYSPYIF